jgi:Tfp pilus assembly protein PilF
MRIHSIAPGVLLAAACAAAPLAAQTPRATVREYQQVFPTYPFSDPNPIPVVGRIYPYFRFDGFAATAQPHAWKVVELENAYLRVVILPEIGGKIWNAVDKRTGRSFIYFNQVVKFRDIAMRGPWTSGGIEANYGIIGHTPNVATPVDYVTRTNPDGSVSCIIGALDLLTRTPWRLEIRLGRDDAAFSTTSFWYNASDLEQPYYSWMNVGIPVRGNLQFVYPGTSRLGHAGEHAPWPVDTAGRDLSWYEHNDFGGYKSYHVFGRETDFFGAYWHDADFGMVRYAPRDEKAGKKIWIWGLSRQGMIWEQLLTDTDGQYAEVQSGRLFNQTAEQSTFTPFKHFGFTPHVADRWTEYWYPVASIGGIVAAGRVGAMNVTPLGDRLIIALSPAEPIADTVRVYAGSRLLYSRFVVRRPLVVFVDTVSVAGAVRDSLRIVVGGDRLAYRLDPRSGDLARPLDAPADFDWQSAYGHYVRGKEWLRQRDYLQATAYLDSALAEEPYFVPALADRAMLSIRALDYEAARGFAATALSVDTYDGAANYYYGLANRRLSRLADAKDGFEVAALSPEYRGAAWTELARMSLAAGDLGTAGQFADKALEVEPANLDALGVGVVAARRRGDWAANARWVARLEAADPLSHQARLERLLAQRDPALPARFAAGIRSELPEQVMLELAAWYVDVGDTDVARRVLEAAGEAPEALYWRAYLLNTADADGGAELLARANAMSPRFVFPFRAELVPSLRWATTQTEDWKPRYFLALAYWGSGRVAEADSLLNVLGDAPDYAPFYAARATLPGRPPEEARRDLERAAVLDSSEWRYGRLLAEQLLAMDDSVEAVAIARRYYGQFPANYILGLTLARALVTAGEYGAADSLLARLDVLPYEGRHDGHVLYRQAKLMLAVEAIRNEEWDRANALIAAARLWPERLGAGKPYDADTDERLEDWLLADVLVRSGQRDGADTLWTRLAADQRVFGSAADLLPVWALDRLGKSAEVAQREAGVPGSYAATDGDAAMLRAWMATAPGGGATLPGASVLRPGGEGDGRSLWGWAAWLYVLGGVLLVALLRRRFRRRAPGS